MWRRIDDFVGRRLGAERAVLARQFAQFALIGAQGFAWDNLVVYSAAPYLGPYWAAVLSYIFVGVINWALNRLWTYRAQAHAPMKQQLLRFLAANLVGFVLNRGVAFFVLWTVPITHIYLVIPLAAGTVSGMFVNFYLSRRYVFG